jgi:hypothetical protein
MIEALDVLDMDGGIAGCRNPEQVTSSVRSRRRGLLVKRYATSLHTTEVDIIMGRAVHVSMYPTHSPSRHLPLPQPPDLPPLIHIRRFPER